MKEMQGQVRVLSSVSSYLVVLWCQKLSSGPQYQCLQCFDAVGWAAGRASECFFWYQPTQVVPEQRPLNSCYCPQYQCCQKSVLRYNRPTLVRTAEQTWNSLLTRVMCTFLLLDGADDSETSIFIDQVSEIASVAVIRCIRFWLHTVHGRLHRQLLVCVARRQQPIPTGQPHRPNQLRLVLPVLPRPLQVWHATGLPDRSAPSARAWSVVWSVQFIARFCIF